MSIHKKALITERDQVQDQSNEEWIAAYSSNPNRGNTKVSELTNNTEPLSRKKKSQYKYLGYVTSNTNGSGRVILRMLDIDSSEILPCFFNAKITHQRGTKKGRNFRTGKNGRFWITENHKLAKFWMKTVKQPPRRWSALDRELNKLKKYTFSGEIVQHPKYTELTNLRAENE